MISWNIVRIQYWREKFNVSPIWVNIQLFEYNTDDNMHWNALIISIVK